MRTAHFGERGTRNALLIRSFGVCNVRPAEGRNFERKKVDSERIIVLVIYGGISVVAGSIRAGVRARARGRALRSASKSPMTTIDFAEI